MARNIRIALASNGFLFAKSHFGRTRREERRRQYREYIQSDAWKRSPARLAELNASGRRCRLCNSGENIEVHHRTYVRLGHELASDLTALCALCHRGVTVMLKERRSANRDPVQQSVASVVAQPNITLASRANSVMPRSGLFRPLVRSFPALPKKLKSSPGDS